jgi:ABC-type transport system involved in cytochrome c biogenesis permease subunit
MDRVYTGCFLASYALALALELLHQFHPRPVLRLLALIAGGAGFVAQSVFLAIHRPPLAWQFGWLVFLTWILAIFYLAGSLHRPQAWGVFVLPLILVLLGVAVVFGEPPRDLPRSNRDLWGRLHGWLVFLAGVGVCIGFLASLMYLIQARQLRTKKMPPRGPRLLSLERLEEMNRRAITLAFPLLTAGVILGSFILFGSDRLSWTDPHVLSACVLWVAFAVMLYLRYGRHMRGRQAAVWTIVTFVLLLCCVALYPSLHQGGGGR